MVGKNASPPLRAGQSFAGWRVSANALNMLAELVPLIRLTRLLEEACWDDLRVAATSGFVLPTVTLLR
jgi:hypothetical protein